MRDWRRVSLGAEYLWAQNFWVPVLMIAIAIGIQFLGLSVWTVVIGLCSLDSPSFIYAIFIATYLRTSSGNGVIKTNAFV
jgi:hypothetical protein